MATIDFDHVTKRYTDGFEAVKDMTLGIADGELMILVGPSGSGKSTALRMAAGSKTSPTASSGSGARWSTTTRPRTAMSRRFSRALRCLRT